MSAQPCGCDPECRVPDHEETIVTDGGFISVIIVRFHTCEEFPSCPFGEGFSTALSTGDLE